LPLARSAAFLPTVRQRQNLISLCKLIGYRLAGPVASTKELRFTLKAPLVHPVTIPAGTTCKAVLEDGDVVFATVADAVILAGDLVADVAARQGAIKREAFVGTERLANTWESELVGAVCCCVSVEEYPPEPAKPRLVLNRPRLNRVPLGLQKRCCRVLQRQRDLVAVAEVPESGSLPSAEVLALRSWARLSPGFVVGSARLAGEEPLGPVDATRESLWHEGPKPPWFQ
jgi:2C-methyl-D-erythritol 2,4-cyclodiphosphate synthase